MQKRHRYAAFFMAISALTAVIGPFATASAQDKPLYVSAYMGLNLYPRQDYRNGDVPVSGDVKFENTPGFTGALGFRLNPSIRLEAEAGYASADMDKFTTNGTSGGLNGELEAMTFMLSGYYDFDLDWPIEPFIGAGAGFGLFDADIRDGGANLTQNSDGNDWSLVYQLGGGLRYKMSDNLSLSGGYRYLGASDIKFDKTNVDFSSHEIRFGLHYDLPVSWDRKGN